jgi:hypothetical protein
MPGDSAREAISDRTMLAEVDTQSMTKVAELEDRIPKLVVTRGAGMAAARITLDGTELGASALGRDLPVDPGAHEIEARRIGGGKPTLVVVELAERERRAVSLASEVPAEATPAPAGPERPRDGESGGGPNTLAILGFSAAGIGLVAGSISGILMFSKRGALEDGCTGDKRCPPPAHGDLDAAYTMATISTVSFIVAGVGAALGVVGLLTDKRQSTAATKGRAKQGRRDPSLAVGGAVLRGSF